MNAAAAIDHPHLPPPLHLTTITAFAVLAVAATARACATNTKRS